MSNTFQLPQQVSAQNRNQSKATPILPPFAVIAGALLIVGSFAAALLGTRPDFHSVTPQTSSPVVTVRHLHFVDQPDGGIAVIEQGSTKPLEVLPAGSHSFLRGTLRSLARARKLQHAGPQAPIDLVRRADGQLSLEDHVSGSIVTLAAFGPTNAIIFEQIMSKRPPAHE
jgi:putative photosynthetic complex assembly protein